MPRSFGCIRPNRLFDLMRPNKSNLFCCIKAYMYGLFGIMPPNRSGRARVGGAWIAIVVHRVCGAGEGVCTVHAGGGEGVDCFAGKGLWTVIAVHCPPRGGEAWTAIAVYCTLREACTAIAVHYVRRVVGRGRGEKRGPRSRSTLCGGGGGEERSVTAIAVHCSGREGAPWTAITVPHT